MTWLATTSGEKCGNFTNPFHDYANEKFTTMKPNFRINTYNTDTKNESNWPKLASSEVKLLQNHQLTTHSKLPLLPLLSSNYSVPLAAENPSITRCDHLVLNQQIPHHSCSYSEGPPANGCCYPLPEAVPAEVHKPRSKKTLYGLTNSRMQKQNLKKQVLFNFNSLKQKESTKSVTIPLLDDQIHNKEQNRHLSDIELMKQVYDELRHKIIQTSQNHVVLEEMKIPKGIDWKECCLGERMRRWGFWFIVAFLAAMTVRDVIFLVTEYMEYPKQSDMNIMFNESMQLPNITFCMSKEQAWSHFILNSSSLFDEWDRKVQEELKQLSSRESFLNEPWDYRLVVEAYEVIATLNSMERETTAQGSARSITVFRTHPRLQTKRNMVKVWLNEIKYRNVTFEELTQKVGFETIKRSLKRFQRTTFKDSLTIKTKFRTSWISTMQFCFQPWFDSKNYYEIEDQGRFFTMVLAHNADNLKGIDIDCMSVDFHGRPSSLSRFMEGKGRARDGYNDDLCLGIRHEITVEVRARYVMLENDENGTACRNNEKEESEFDCHSKCRMKMIRAMCNCTPPTLSYLVQNVEEYYVYPICNYEECKIQTNKNYSDMQCARKCYRLCDQVTYEVNHVQQGKTVNRDLTMINLNWGSFEYLTLTQYWVWSMPTFIAALGGSMGAWLGLSILSLIQGGTYLYIFLTETIKKKSLLKRLNWIRIPLRDAESFTKKRELKKFVKESYMTNSTN